MPKLETDGMVEWLSRRPELLGKKDLNDLMAIARELKREGLFGDEVRPNKVIVALPKMMEKARALLKPQ